MLTPVMISGLTLGMWETVVTMLRTRLFMLCIPMAAIVPSRVTRTDDTTAMISEVPSALRIISLWNRLRYQSSVKPVNTVRLLLSLKLNTISTAMGTYRKLNSRQR